MKKVVFVSLMGALTVLGGLRVEAALITGDITFGSRLERNTDLSTITAVDFEPQTAFVTGVTGDLDAFTDPGQLAVLKDFSFNPFTENNPLWEVGGMSFYLRSLTINTQNSNFLGLQGKGFIWADGFEDTDYEWSLSADRTRNTIAVSMTNDNVVVPEPNTFALMGLGALLLCLAVRQRQHLQQVNS